jgi:lipopolysaccharide transport system permease protein
MMVVFSLFFGRLAGVTTNGIPYPVFALTALIPWQLFSRAITESTNSLITDQRLISRVYFPRIIVPFASTFSGFIEFAISSGLLVVVFLVYQIPLRPEIIWLPAFFLLLMLTSLGVGFWLSALNVEYRDVSYTIPFLTQFWFFITPVVYSSDIVPERWRTLYGLNPMTGVVEGFRWALLGAQRPPDAMTAASTLISIAMFLGGIAWFRARERTFADCIGSGGR